MSVQDLITRFERDLGTEEYVSPSLLVQIGVFASYSACMKAIRKGTIPCLKISPHRHLIPRKSVIEYLYDRATV